MAKQFAREKTQAVLDFAKKCCKKGTYYLKMWAANLFPLGNHSKAQRGLILMVPSSFRWVKALTKTAIPADSRPKSDKLIFRSSTLNSSQRRQKLPKNYISMFFDLNYLWLIGWIGDFEKYYDIMKTYSKHDPCSLSQRSGLDHNKKRDCHLSWRLLAFCACMLKYFWWDDALVLTKILTITSSSLNISTLSSRRNIELHKAFSHLVEILSHCIKKVDTPFRIVGCHCLEHLATQWWMIKNLEIKISDPGFDFLAIYKSINKLNQAGLLAAMSIGAMTSFSGTDHNLIIRWQQKSSTQTYKVRTNLIGQS